MKRIAITLCAFAAVALLAFFFLVHKGVLSRAQQKNMVDCLKQGNDEFNAGHYDRAIELLEAGLAQAKEQGNLEYQTAFDVTLGSAYASVFKYDKALAYATKALELSKVRGDQLNQAGALNTIAATYTQSGEYEKAIESFKEAVSILKEIGQEQTAARLTYNIAEQYRLMGRYQESLKCLEELLQVTEKLNDPVAGGRTNCSMGFVYNQLGQYERALYCYDAALKTGEYQRDDALRAEALTGLGETHALLGEGDQSASCLKKAVEASQRSGNPRLQAQALSALGILQLTQKDYRGAPANFAKALSLNEKMQDTLSQISCLSNLAYCYQELNDLPRALEFLDRAQKMMPRVADGLEKAQLLNNRGLVLMGVGRLSEAKDAFRQGADLFDRIRGQMGNSEERSAVFDTLPYVHIGLAAAELELGQPQAAFEAVERWRSKSLIDLLATRLSGLQRFQKSEEVKRLQEKLTALGRTADRAVTADLERQRLILIQEIREKDPQLSTLTTVQTPKLADIASALDPDVCLVEFFHPVTYPASGSTRDELWIFTVSNGKLSFARSPVTKQQLNEGLKEFRETAGDPESTMEEVRQASQKIYDWVFRPVEDSIGSAQTLVIVPWGEAFHVPYAALWHANAKGGGAWLGEERKMVVAPSGYALPFLQKQRSNRHSSIYAVGNPLTGYTPLPGAEREAMEVAALFPQREVWLGAGATETRIKNAIGHPDVIHFATHGLFNPDAPVLSKILLASDNLNDGSLEGYELFALDWRGVSLVTLSACSSGKTELHPGDDIVGLIQGCFFAGTPSVLASLWEVDDEATRRLMLAFYQALLTGHSKPEALQIAQAAIRKDSRFSHPMFWSAFELFGDWQ